MGLRLPRIDYALEDLNTLNGGFEGVYPPEIETPWVTRTFFNSKNPQKDDEPFAYQFTGIGKEEKTVSNKKKSKVKTISKNQAKKNQFI